MPGVSRQSYSAVYLRRLKQDHGWARVRNNDATHLLLSGGTYPLHREHEERLLDLLASDIERDNANYVVERKTEIFKFCQDYDCMSTVQAGPVTLETALQYIRATQKVLAQFAADVDASPYELRVIVCSAPTKLRTQTISVADAQGHYTQEDVQLVKSGFHTVWPEVDIDSKTAMYVRYATKQMIEREVGSVLRYRDEESGRVYEYDNMDDLLDMSIYKANGLRMLGSRKASRCKACARKRRHNCDDCQGTGYIDEGRPYTVACVLDGNGEMMPEEMQKLQNDVHYAIRQTSIRLPGMREMAWVPRSPSWFVLDNDTLAEIDRVLGVRTTAATTRARTLHMRASTARVGEVFNIMIHNTETEFECLDCRSDPRAMRLQNFINDCGISGDRQVLRKVLVSTDSSRPRIIAIGANKWCLNKNGAHYGQDVYYWFNGRTIAQRCFSTKDCADRLHGPCTGARAIRFFNDKAVRVPLAISKQWLPQQPEPEPEHVHVQPGECEQAKKHRQTYRDLRRNVLSVDDDTDIGSYDQLFGFKPSTAPVFQNLFWQDQISRHRYERVNNS